MCLTVRELSPDGTHPIGLPRIVFDGGQVNIYPNPTTGMVNIDVDALESVEVMDMAGRVVMTSNQSNIDMSALANGVYMFRVNTATGSTMQKVVKR